MTPDLCDKLLDAVKAWLAEHMGQGVRPVVAFHDALQAILAVTAGVIATAAPFHDRRRDQLGRAARALAWEDLTEPVQHLAEPQQQDPAPPPK